MLLESLLVTLELFVVLAVGGFIFVAGVELYDRLPAKWQIIVSIGLYSAGMFFALWMIVYGLMNMHTGELQLK